MVTSRVAFDWLTGDQCAAAIPLLDREFIYTRSRAVSFAVRYGDVFAGSGCIAAAVTGNAIVGALILHPFTWMTRTQVWQGAMIGGVSTAPAYRSCGIASQLLDAAQQRCTQSNYA